MYMENKKDAFLIARIPKKMKEAIVKEAKEQNKNISKLIREILNRYLD